MAPNVGSRLFSRRYWPAWLALAAGLAGTVWFAQRIRDEIVDDAVQEFAYASDQVTQHVQERLWTYGLLLRGAAGVFAANEDVTRDEWRQYVEKLQPQRNLPGVQGVGFAEFVPAGDLPAHVARVRADGFAQYSVFPPGERGAYAPIVYLEPFNERNQRAFGFDMLSEPTRRRAMEAARDSGQAVLSGRVQLIQETESNAQAGTLIYVPVYRPGAEVATIGQRRAALIGWTYSPYRMDDLMSGMLGDWQGWLGSDMHLSVYDGESLAPVALLYRSPGGAVDDAEPSHFRQQRQVDFNGHRWTLLFDRDPASMALDTTRVWRAVAGGLVISVLLFGLVFLLLDTREEAVRRAAELTEDIRRSKRELQASEFRWKFALEGSDLGVWDWDLGTGRMFFSPRWKQILGFAAEELADDQASWLERIHPDDQARVRAEIEDCQVGHGRSCISEHRLLRKDGSYCWVLVRGMVIERSDLGAPLRMIGTCADVSEQHLAQARIGHLSRLYAALSAGNAAMLRGGSEAELFAEICRVVVEQGGMRMAWIGLVDEGSGRVLARHASGTGTDYLEGIEILVSGDDPRGRGATGTAIRENRPVWVDDFLHNPITGPWQERARRYGWAASAALPLCRGGKPIGALTFYSDDTGWYDDDTRAVLEEMARDISFALDKFVAEAEAKANQAGLMEAEQRFRCMVEQSIAGAYIHQELKFVYANPRLAQILGYPSGEAMIGVPVRNVIAAKDLAMAERQFARLMAGEIDQTDYVFTARRLDGSEVEVGVNSSRATYRQQPAVIGLMQDVTDRRVAEEQIRRYTKQLEDVFIQTVGLATTISEMRDPYTAGHEQRVAQIAVAIGQEMGLDAKTLEGLRIGGYLHDVGKIRVPSEILSKPGRLSDSEYELVKDHARAGYEVLKDVDFPWPVAQIALQHHERIDGSGYPQGLKGDQILLEARVLAVADVIESMSSHRPYRPGLGLEKALAEIERGNGSAYDPVVVAACLRLFRDKGYRPEA